MALKDILDNVSECDTIVVSQPAGHYAYPYLFGNVVKSTKSQVTVKINRLVLRFNKSTGKEIGASPNYYHSIATDFYGNVLTIEDAQAHNAEIEQEQEKRMMIAKITNAKKSHLSTLPFETLRQVITMLDLE